MCISTAARRNSLTRKLPTAAFLPPRSSPVADGSRSTLPVKTEADPGSVSGGAVVAAESNAVPPHPAQQHQHEQQHEQQQQQHEQQQHPTHPTSEPLHHNHGHNKHPESHVHHAYHDHATDPRDETKYATRGGVTTPFPLKLHTMLDKIEADGLADVVSWQPHGRCFVVHKPKEFVENVMPKYFKQSKFASFQRQLNLYGFSRLTSGLDRGGYYHEMFLRDKTWLCHKIHRMRVKGTGVRMASSPESEPNFYGMAPVGVRVQLPASRSNGSVASMNHAGASSQEQRQEEQRRRREEEEEDHRKRFPVVVTSSSTAAPSSASASPLPAPVFSSGSASPRNASQQQPQPRRGDTYPLARQENQAKPAGQVPPIPRPSQQPQQQPIEQRVSRIVEQRASRIYAQQRTTSQAQAPTAPTAPIPASTTLPRNPRSFPKMTFYPPTATTAGIKKEEEANYDKAYVPTSSMEYTTECYNVNTSTTYAAAPPPPTPTHSDPHSENTQSLTTTEDITDDQDLDEVEFEGKVFHYLAPFDEDVTMLVSTPSFEHRRQSQGSTQAPVPDPTYYNWPTIAKPEVVEQPPSMFPSNDVPDPIPPSSSSSVQDAPPLPPQPPSPPPSCARVRPIPKQNKAVVSDDDEEAATPAASASSSSSLSIVKSESEDMDAFFASLGLDILDDTEMTDCLGDDTAFGFMLEKVLE